MSLVGGCHRHPVMPNGKYSLDAAAATANPCHEENPYLHGWLIRHPDMSPINFSAAPSNSPEYATGAPGFEFSRLGNVPTGTSGIIPNPTKGRGTANRKEKRRTEGLNGAFAELRDCLPNVPVDTKLSKIKTLRLATSYIAYLMDLLGKDEQNGETEGFKGELRKAGIKEEHYIKKELNEVLKISESNNDKKTKGRTGWPQHVWALELKH